MRFELVVAQARQAGSRRILDYGAGAGLLGDFVVREHPDLGYSFGESSPLLRAQLLGRFGAEAEAPAEAAIPSGTSVAMLDVIEHIEDDTATLIRLWERMQPGSHLIVTAPAMPWAYSSWDEALGHFRRYTKVTMADLLRRAGFAKVETCYLFPELFPLLIIRRLRRAPRPHADFPRLNATLDALGYRIASATTAARRLWPFGASVVAVAIREW